VLPAEVSKKGLGWWCQVRLPEASLRQVFRGSPLTLALLQAQLGVGLGALRP
jgi:hypothetical protein